jgi:formylglycine-generating enzyme required for sulfatase activity
VMGRYALLVGISNYSHLNPLPSAVKDVAALRQVLTNPDIGGFAESDVVVLMDVEKGAIEAAIYNLFASRKTDDLLLFYFSGHGVTDSRNDFYFTGLATHKDALPPTAVPSEYVHKMMNQSRSKYQVVILDCCHSGAFSKGMTAKGVGTVQVLPKLGGEGRAILTASDSTQYAFEQEGFELSLYTHFLVEGLKTGAADRDEDGAVSVDELYEYVRDKVKSVNDLMSPEIYPVREGHRIVLAKAIRDDKLKFRKEVEKVVLRNNGRVSAIARNLLARKWQELKIDPREAEAIISEVLRPYLEYSKKIEEYKQTLLEAIAEEFPFSKAMQEDLREYELHLGLREKDILEIIAKIIKPKEQAMIRAKQEQELTLDLGQGMILELVRIPSGKFMMGSDEYDSEKPIHEVTVPAFLMGKYAVTNAQWEAVMGTKPAEKYDVKFQGKNQPVVGVSWNNCVEFCRKLSITSGENIRLPSEAEWEYACWTGTQTKYHFGNDENQLVSYAWYSNNSGGQTHPVGKKSPNQFGLYDMHGNVWEWCSDRWHENYNGAPIDASSWDSGTENNRVLRGGSWNRSARHCRSGFRVRGNAEIEYDFFGFRVACLPFLPRTH